VVLEARREEAQAAAALAAPSEDDVFKEATTSES